MALAEAHRWDNIADKQACFLALSSGLAGQAVGAAQEQQ